MRSDDDDDVRFDRKLKQLCREVFRVLSQCDLDGASVVDVQPAPDGSRLAVQLAVEPGTDIAFLLERLEHKKGELREEIASAIQRKRTPLLVFEVLP
jgi:ribosome-binding factor A